MMYSLQMQGPLKKKFTVDLWSGLMTIMSWMLIKDIVMATNSYKIFVTLSRKFEYKSFDERNAMKSMKAFSVNCIKVRLDL